MAWVPSGAQLIGYDLYCHFAFRSAPARLFTFDFDIIRISCLAGQDSRLLTLGGVRVWGLGSEGRTLTR